jgi:VCBS repeat-containing protein
MSQVTERDIMAKTYKVLVNGGKEAELKTISVVQGAGDRSAPVRLVSERGVRYELVDDVKGKGFAPDEVRLKRMGKNLLLMFSESQSADVVFENFYDAGQAGDAGVPTLVGNAENGNLYEYVPQDPEVSHLVSALADGNAPVIMSLGGDAMSGAFVLSALPLVAAAGGISGWAIAGGVAAAAAAGGGGGGGGGAALPDKTAPSAVKVVMPEAAQGLNAQEAQDGSTLEVELPADAVAGDTLNTVLTKPDGTTLVLAPYVLTADDITAKKVVQPIPVDALKDSDGQYIDGKWAASSTLKDAANNVSEPVTTEFVLDTASPSFESAALAPNVDENIATTAVVYHAKATDAAAVTYTLKTGVADGDLFAINPTTGEVTLKSSPDFETKPNYSFTVLATDAAGNTTEQVVTLAISNVDEVAPTFASGSVAPAVAENTAVGTTIYTASAKDADFVSPHTEDSVTYRLKTGGDAASFTIDELTGEVKLAESPNYEAKPSYTFTVEAVDAVGHATEKTVELKINDVAEAAVIDDQTQPGAFGMTNLPLNLRTTAWAVKVTDPDLNQSELQSLAGQAGTFGRFEYDPAKSMANIYAWTYTLDDTGSNPALQALTAIGHDLQVIRSLDGSVYKTIDIAVNTNPQNPNSATRAQFFHTKSTEGLTVTGDIDHTDTLVLHGTTLASATLDLTVATSKVATLHSVEHIDLTGSTNYTVKLNMASLTQADAVSGVHQLWIEGSAGDTVVIANPSVASDASVIGYYRYVLDATHELLVQQALTVAFIG